MKNSTPFSHETPNSKKINFHKVLNYNDEIEPLHVPSSKAVNAILAFSKSLEVKHSKHLGFVDSILN